MLIKCASVCELYLQSAIPLKLCYMLLYQLFQQQLLYSSLLIAGQSVITFIKYVKGLHISLKHICRDWPKKNRVP